MARICREAGARVKENQLLHDLHVIVPADDSAGSRSSRTAFHFAIDTTVVSALTGRGMARGRRQGQAIHEAEQDKCRRCHELVNGSRAFKVAGR